MEMSTMDPHLKQDIAELTEWSVGELHKLPSIHEFMKGLGGCTKEGKLYSRLEEKQIASIVLTGWSGADLPRYAIKNKRCILTGSPGAGKSTMLCLLAFYVAFEQKKNVLVYRKYFTVPKCEVSQAREIYKALQLKREVYLMLDGFDYKDIPEGLQTFKLLATSVLHPSWLLKDLKCLGQLLKGWDEDQVSERYYYSGGNVRQFLLDIVEEIRIRTLDYLRYMDDPFQLRQSVDPNDQLNFIAFDVMDSEYAILTLSTRLNPDYLYRIFNWARAAGHALLAGSAFELCLHLFAADNRLKLYVSEYEHPEPSKPDCDRYLNVKLLRLQHGRPACTGTATDYETDLTKWRDNDNFVYWFPHCYDFPNIDSIVKLKLGSGKKQVAYLQITTGKEHSLDVQQLKTMNEIFKQEQADPPIYIVVCPDLASCKRIVLTPANTVSEAIKENIQVFAGYSRMD
ncbi:hypothetical protein Ae201684P_002108 [Aphanomyces euteiches]|nr:hypothetical protein Ae201684P_002108 [Aphanomyces euteiches]